MAFILNLLWSNWPRRVFIQFTSYRPSLVKSSRRRAVWPPQDLACSSCCFFIRQVLDPISDNSEVTQSGQIQGDGLACWSIGNSARISILMLHWVMVMQKESQHDFSSNSACQSNLEFSPNICSNTKSNSAIPAKLASASLFAGQFRGDSTLIQTQFGFLI